MEWVTVLSQILEYVEDTLYEKFDLEKIQEITGVTKVYLDKYFSSMTGYSIAEYSKNRKLYLAALDLINTKDSILKIAVKYAYQTNESFSRAFYRKYGYTPNSFRRNRPYIKSFPKFNIHVTVSGGNGLEYEFVNVEKMKIVGIEYSIAYENHDENIRKIWDDFNIACLNEGDSNKKAKEYITKNNIGEYGIEMNVSNSEFSKYIIGGKFVSDNIPNGFMTYEFPATKMVKFSSVGPLPDAMIILNKRIANEWANNYPYIVFNYDYHIEHFEHIGKDYYKITVYLPIKELKFKKESIL